MKPSRRIVPACIVVLIETRHGRTGGELRARWLCETCDEHGDWTTPDEAHAGGDAHVESVRKGKAR